MNPSSTSPACRTIWPLLTLNFFMADMQAGIGPFLGVFLLAHGWQSGAIGTVMTLGGVAGMLMTAPAGALVDATRTSELWSSFPASARCSPPGSCCCRRTSGWWRPSQVATAHRRRRDRAGGDGHHARHRAPARLQPAVRPQPGRQSRRQRGRRGLSGLLGWHFGFGAVFWLAAASACCRSSRCC